MTTSTMLMLLVLGTFLVNLPFGWMRARTRRFSRGWVLCVHAPIPLVVLTRLALGIGWGVVPFLLLAALSGQALGGRLFPAPVAGR